MANENILEFYEAACAEHEIEINPHIKGVLDNLTTKE